MEQILITYYADNARKLHRMVDRILLKFGGIYGKDKIGRASCRERV